MFEKETIRDYLQNKNIVMFITSATFMVGILAYFYNLPILIAGVVTFVIACLMLLNIISIRRTVILIMIFYFGFFITFLKIKNYDELLKISPTDGDFIGIISSIPDASDQNKIKFFLDIENISGQKIQGKTLVMMPKDETKYSMLNIGEKITIQGSLRKPFVATNPSQFDYSKYLKNFNIFTVLYNNDGNYKIVKYNPNFKWKLLQRLSILRNKIISTHSAYLKSPNLEILGGIVFGDDAVAPPDYIKNSFINSGLLHILAASGMNVGFIYMFCFYILNFLKVPYRPSVITGILAIILYTFMTGLGPSVIRAAMMLIFVLVGKLIDRDAHSVSLLSLVAVLMLLYNPAFINNVSFQLSFLVTLGLLTSSSIIDKIFKSIPNTIKGAIFIPIIAQIWIAPIQMFYFNTLTIYSIFANISTVCLLSIISFSGFISSILSLLPKYGSIICGIFDFANNFLLNILVNISNFFSNLPHCILQTTHPSVIQLLIYYAMLICATYLIKTSKYKKALITIASVSIILVLTTIKPVSDNLEIIMFDVGNADSFLVKTPKKKYFFIDTGKAAYKSTNSQAKIIMLKYLKDRGIKNIEGIIVTHFDNDHSGGTKDFIENTKVKTLYLNNQEQTTETAKEIFKTIKEIGQNVKFVNNNEIIYTEPDLFIKTFKPSFKDPDKSNENSTITLLSYKNFDTLFMADANAASFEQIQNKIPHNIDVLKVGHHGGPNVVDASMIKHLNNRVSLISTGTNTFGHPNKGTLDELRNTSILRTDQLNSVKITSDGNVYKIFAYDNYNRKYKIKEKFETK